MSDIKRYTWNFNENAEYWGNSDHDTIQECIDEARRDAAIDENQTAVYIGECIPFVPSVDAECLLDRIQELACEECGEAGYDWDGYDYKKQDEIEELETAMTPVLHEWMKKHGYYPNIYRLENIRKHSLCDTL